MSLLRFNSNRFVCHACRNAARGTQQVATRYARPQFAASATGIRNVISRRGFTISTQQLRDRNDPNTRDPEYAFLSDGSKPGREDRELLEAEQEELLDEEQDLLDEEGLLDQEEALDAKEATIPSSTAPSIPWYLRQQSVPQVQTPAHIPDLPPNPPPLLDTILQYVSVTAGLDDLELLDLRHLDPPPALGPKLIMIIATARSEKHLHVAADRFARWLRREHGLKANAAGLLGRNELKIKLRRKAKRMRMLANVGGAMPEGNIDDGIRTGWICCTLSKIEAHPDDQHMPGDHMMDFIGFRDVKPGVNVVVQMFTEEKRAETDLETLWGGVVKTHQRSNQVADGKLEEVDVERQDGTAFKSYGKETQDEPAMTPPSPPPQQFRRPRSTKGDMFPSA